MTTAARTPLIQFFIPAVTAFGVNVAQLASTGVASPTSCSRLTYRFLYRLSRGGLVYGCRIKTSMGMAELLIERLYALADQATHAGDSALLVGCAMALAAIADAREDKPELRLA